MFDDRLYGMFAGQCLVKFGEGLQLVCEHNERITDCQLNRLRRLIEAPTIQEHCTRILRLHQPHPHRGCQPGFPQPKQRALVSARQCMPYSYKPCIHKSVSGT